MAKIDGRSAEGRFVRRVRLDLIAHCGGSPSAVQHALIDRVTWLRLRIAAMESKTPAGAQMPECDSRTYLAWCGSLSRLMRELGPAMTPITARPKTLAEIRAGHAARTAA